MNLSLYQCSKQQQKAPRFARLQVIFLCTRTQAANHAHKQMIATNIYQAGIYIRGLYELCASNAPAYLEPPSSHYSG